MAGPKNVIGIDIGSAALGVAEIDPTGELIKYVYDFHHGHADDHLKGALESFDLSRVCGMAATSSTPSPRPHRIRRGSRS